MQAIVEQLLAVQALAKEVHWNGRGPGFIAVHAYLDTVYDDAARFTDLVAEHMAATQHYGDPSWSVPPFEHFPRVLLDDNPRDLRRGLQQLVQLIVNLVDALDEYTINFDDDPAGQDLVIQAAQVFNKHLWQLSSELN
jgi:DNA-binding ferritin-like protein